MGEDTYLKKSRLFFSCTASKILNGVCNKVIVDVCREIRNFIRMLERVVVGGNKTFIWKPTDSVGFILQGENGMMY